MPSARRLRKRRCLRTHPCTSMRMVRVHPLNDKTETLAFKKALGQKAYEAVISSTKSMTGHMLGATGALEAIVCALALQNSVVPPTIHYQEPDPECDLDYTPNTARKVELDYALSTNLGFGGHNACLALKKYNG